MSRRISWDRARGSAIRRRILAATVATGTAIAAIAIGVTVLGTTASQAAAPAPVGPCDIFAAGGTPCVNANSTTRALYGAYDGPLYQVQRASDNATANIFPVAAGGVANGAAQDAFCANTQCQITIIYDQTDWPSATNNNLTVAPPGNAAQGPMPAPAGGGDNESIATQAPLSLDGQEAYGLYIAPGMGYRIDDAVNTAWGDEPEGEYAIFGADHYNGGCCFDYGNMESNSNDTGDGSMEALYFGTESTWSYGPNPGPWPETDQENNLVSGDFSRYNFGDLPILPFASGPFSSANPTTPTTSGQFLTDFLSGGSTTPATPDGQWEFRTGNAQAGTLTTDYNGPRTWYNTTDYNPMVKHGSDGVGNGGDNSDGSDGTWYEGVMTTGYPTDATTNAVAANIAAAQYEPPMLALSQAAPFSSSSSQNVTETFTNYTTLTVTGVQLGANAPAGWTVTPSGSTSFASVAPGASVSATFAVGSPSATGNATLTGKATWANPGSSTPETYQSTELLRDTQPIRINEIRFSTTTPSNSSNQYVDLYNAGATNVNVGGYNLNYYTTGATNISIPLATIPAGTTMAPNSYYVFGRSYSTLAAPAVGATNIVYVTSTTGATNLGATNALIIDPGPNQEAATIATVGTAASTATAIFRPLRIGQFVTGQNQPFVNQLTIPTGSTNVPVVSASGFTVGQQMTIGLPPNQEQFTVTKVGTAGLSTYLADGNPAAIGATNIRPASDSGVAPGDTIWLVGTGSETPLNTESDTVLSVSGSTVNLMTPLVDAFSAGSTEVWDRESGISFTPPTGMAYSSNTPVQALGTGLKLANNLNFNHSFGAAVLDPAATTAGYQGTPNQWFTTTLSTTGALELADPSGLDVDSLNFTTNNTGTIDSPLWEEGVSTSNGPGALTPNGPASDGYQIFSCYATSAAVSGAFPSSDTNGVVLARIPNGQDTGSNCNDFQDTTNATPGAANVPAPQTSVSYSPLPTVVDNSGFFTQLPQVTLTATDAATTCYALDQVPALGATNQSATCTAPWSTYTTPFTPSVPAGDSPDGAHLLQYYSVDSLGQVEGLHSVVLKIDTTPSWTTPTTVSTGATNVSVTNPSGGPYAVVQNGGSVTLTLSSADALPGPTNPNCPTDLLGGTSAAACNLVEFPTAPSGWSTTPSNYAASGQSTPDFGPAQSNVNDQHLIQYECSPVANCAGQIGGGGWQAYWTPVVITGGGLTVVTYYSNDDAGNTEALKTVDVQINPQATTAPTGSVASDLALSIGGATPSFGTFTAGVAQTYSTTTGATVTTTAAGTTLTASDPSTTFPGHLVNNSTGGPYEMVQGLQVNATSTNAAAISSGYTNLGADPSATGTILTYSAPVSNDAVTIGFQQAIAATDPLRTGTYSKTITFTLSTSTP